MSKKRQAKHGADAVGALLAEYRAVVPDERGNSHRKWEIIEYKLLSREDERLLPFFLEVAGDKTDCYLARIAVFKHLGWKVSELQPPSEQYEMIGRVLVQVMRDAEDDNLVR